jgi:starch-binding outer membrane protein, SusD/RagB family
LIRFIKKLMMNKRILSIAVLASTLMFTQSSCIKEYTDPSSITEAQVVSSIDGVAGLINGLQSRYSVGRQSPLYQSFSASGLVTNELRVLNLGNTDEVNFAAGLGSVLPSNSGIAQLWAQSFLMMGEANLVIASKGVTVDPKNQAVIQAYGHFYKAIAIGNLATFFEKMPITIGKNQPFVTREEALKSAITLLEGAESVLATADAASISAFSAGRFVAGFDIKNSVIALQARYNLMLKDYGKAKAAADKVALGVKSAFRFDAVSTNPIFFVAYSNRNVVENTNKNLGLPTALALDTLDKRIPFYLNPAASATVNLGFGFFRTNTTDIPVYLPGEMSLIKAECLAQTDVAAAVTELSNLMKKKAAADAWGVGADLAAGYTGAATKDAVLTEIYRQRCIELCNSGLRLEDSRRLGRPGPDQPAATRERGRNFFPYPQSERDNNTSTPTDPAL